MSKTHVKTTLQLTSAQMKLLDFFDSKEIPDLLKCTKRVFEIACFFSMLKLVNFDITALYMQFELIELLNEIKEENCIS